MAARPPAAKHTNSGLNSNDEQSTSHSTLAQAIDEAVRHEPASSTAGLSHVTPKGAKTAPATAQTAAAKVRGRDTTRCGARRATSAREIISTAWTSVAQSRVASSTALCTESSVPLKKMVVSLASTVAARQTKKACGCPSGEHSCANRGIHIPLDGICLQKHRCHPSGAGRFLALPPRMATAL